MTNNIIKRKSSSSIRTTTTTTTTPPFLASFSSHSSSFSSHSSSSPLPSPYCQHHLNNLDNLPSDPKNWSSKDVSEYLYRCLQSSTYPPKVILELTNYIKKDTLNFNGRKFLRLKEEQLKLMRFDDDDVDNWINLIMIGVKSLRREMLKEKILLKNNNKQHDKGDYDDEKEGYFNYFDDSVNYIGKENNPNKNDDNQKEKERNG
jgi:hypothetical protein